MLIYFGVIPYLVFDGDYLPSKAATETERAKRRNESRRAGLELYRVGKPSQAQKELQKAVDVTPEMAGQLIRELKKLGVQYVVAPYEADAQLAYLERKNIIQGVLSEDSDLLVFGVKCLLTKLDQYGDCVEINRKDFTACRDISLIGWSDAEFRLMAILSGCDYLTNITNLGLLTAYRMVRKHKTIERILAMLQFDGKYYVPLGYLEAFQNAVSTFRHQRVYCPSSGRLAMVTDPDPERDLEALDFIGKLMEPETAAKVARGDLHPMTKKPLGIPESASDAHKTVSGGIARPNSVKFTDLKENKSIESFFQKKRRPLAELDPNKFTPSPSQQRLQQQANGAWMSSPIPHEFSARSLVHSERLLTTPSPAVSNPYRQPQPSSSTQQQPSKRRRLCSDPVSESSTSLSPTRGEVGQSRFFAPMAAQPSCKEKPAKRTRINTADIHIWSDDSVEDVMSELQEVIDCADKGTPKPSVVEDSADQAQETKDKDVSSEKTLGLICAMSTVQQDSQSSTATDSTGISKVSVSTSATSIKSSTQKLFHNVDNHLTAELAVWKEKFERVPGPGSVAHQQNAANLKVKPGEYQRMLRTPAEPQITRKDSCTPLQRLGASALRRPQRTSGLNGDTKSILHYCAPKLGLSTNGTPRPFRAIENDPMVEADRPTLQKSSDLPINKGSEDLIVPASEEDSVYSPVSVIKTTESPKLNLEKFAFSDE